MSEFKDEDVRNAANSIKTLREKRESLVESIAEIDKLLGVQDAQGVDGLIAMYHKYKPLLVKAGLVGAGGGGFAFAPKILDFLRGLLGG
jgi:hypothetical protein